MKFHDSWIIGKCIYFYGNKVRAYFDESGELQLEGMLCEEYFKVKEALMDYLGANN